MRQLHERCTHHELQGMPTSRRAAAGPVWSLLPLSWALAAALAGVTAPLSTSAKDVASVTYREGTEPRQIRAFVSSSNTGTLYVNYWTGTPPWLWAHLGSPTNASTRGSPAAVTFKRAGRQQIHVFTYASNGSLYISHWNGYEWAWRNQGEPPGTTAVGNAPGVITYRDEAGRQRVYAFVRGANGNYYLRYWNGLEWLWADQGRPPGGGTPGSPSVITYPEAGTQRIYMFDSGNGSTLKLNYWNGTKWDWTDQGAPPGVGVGGAPGALTYRSGDIQRIFAFVRGNDGKLWANRWNGFGWRWIDYGRPVGTSVTGTPRVLTFKETGQPRKIYAFVRGADSQLHLNYWDGLQWRWLPQGTPDTAAVAGVLGALTYRDDVTLLQQVLVFVQGTDPA